MGDGVSTLRVLPFHHPFFHLSTMGQRKRNSPRVESPKERSRGWGSWYLVTGFGLILTLSSSTLPLSQVYDAAANVLAQRVSQMPGVGQDFVGGAQLPTVRVQVDPATS